MEGGNVRSEEGRLEGTMTEEEGSSEIFWQSIRPFSSGLRALTGPLPRKGEDEEEREENEKGRKEGMEGMKKCGESKGGR